MRPVTLRRTLPNAVLLTVPAYLVAVGARQLTERLLAAGTEGPGAVAAAPHSVLPGLASYTALLLLSLLLFAMVDRRPWSAFGLRRPEGRWLGFLLQAFAVGTVVTFLLRLTPGKGMEEALRGVDPALLLASVLYGSAAEEFFTRGWFQSFLEPLRDRTVPLAGFAPSLPVVASAILFGAMHLTLLLRGADPWTVGFVLVFTTTVGLIAATARERTGSLGPATLAHLAGNAGGAFGGVLFALLRLARGGPPMTP